MAHRSWFLFCRRNTGIAGSFLSSSHGRIARLLRAALPVLLPLALTAAAQAQGTMDFSGAQTLMQTFNVGAVAIQSQVIVSYRIQVETEQTMDCIDCHRI
jgi:hypothetical protein